RPDLAPLSIERPSAESSARDRYERLLRTRSELVNGSRHDVLSDSRLADHEHRRRNRCGERHELVEPLHHAASPDETPEAVVTEELPLEPAQLAEVSKDFHAPDERSSLVSKRLERGRCVNFATAQPAVGHLDAARRFAALLESGE